MVVVASNMMQGLTQSANVVVIRMKDILKVHGKGGYPAVISDSISIDSPIQEADNRYSITIKVDLKKAPMAAAFELGSGLHDIRSPSLYPIPRTDNTSAQELHFFWKERGKWFKGQRLPFGHPGIVAKPFMKPSVIETKPEVTKILGDKFKTSILLGIKEVWSNQ